MTYEEVRNEYNTLLNSFIKKLSLNDDKTLSQKLGKVVEECGELSKNILSYENANGYKDKIVKKDSILEESVDIILSSISIPLSLGYTIDDINSMLYKKCIHWENKQSKEKDIEYPIWFETHITIERPNK